MMRRRTSLLMATMLALSACGSHEQADSAPAAPAGPRLLLAASDVPDWQDVSAEVVTVDQAQVMARMPGVLSSLSVRAGDSVRRGQVIGRIGDSIGGGAASAEAASAQAGLARAELDRVKYLYQNGVYAKARLEQAEAAARVAGVQASAASAAETVVAPSNGRVLQADVPAGSPVGPGTVLAVITSGPVVLRLTMPESLGGAVRVGSRVRADGVGSGPMTGTVTKLYPAITAGQISADVTVPGLDASFIGRRVGAKVAAGSRKGLVVPRAFVTTRYGIDYVTVLGKDGSAAAVPVQTAPTGDPARVEILSGAAAGDTLVGTGK